MVATSHVCYWVLEMYAVNATEKPNFYLNSINIKISVKYLKYYWYWLCVNGNILDILSQVKYINKINFPSFFFLF